MAENKTKYTGASVKNYIAARGTNSIAEARRRYGKHPGKRS
jgi:hypothetical protein